MTNITVNFTYDLADDEYYQTSSLRKTGTIAYKGPETIYIIVDANTNHPTGGQITEEQHETFNDVNDGRFYSVEVNCHDNPLMCSFYNGSIIADELEQVAEEIPHSIPYVRPNPPMPDHTYEFKEILVDRATGTFVKPLPWKKPHMAWSLDYNGGTAQNSLLSWRNSQLRNTDRQLSEDLPQPLYNKMIEYRQYLRDFTEIFGVAWTVTVNNGGTGYAVGDRLLISDPRFKAGHPVSDIMVTITEVLDGEITAIKPGERLALHYPAAAQIEDVFFTTNGQGTGATLNLSKLKTIDPWKITPKDSPLG
jgi:hypothetical protein